MSMAIEESTLLQTRAAAEFLRPVQSIDGASCEDVEHLDAADQSCAVPSINQLFIHRTSTSRRQNILHALEVTTSACTRFPKPSPQPATNEVLVTANANQPIVVVHLFKAQEELSVAEEKQPKEGGREG